MRKLLWSKSSSSTVFHPPTVEDRVPREDTRRLRRGRSLSPTPFLSTVSSKVFHPPTAEDTVPEDSQISGIRRSRSLSSMSFLNGPVQSSDYTVCNRSLKPERQQFSEKIQHSLSDREPQRERDSTLLGILNIVRSNVASYTTFTEAEERKASELQKMNSELNIFFEEVMARTHGIPEIKKLTTEAGKYCMLLLEVQNQLQTRIMELSECNEIELESMRDKLEKTENLAETTELQLIQTDLSRNGDEIEPLSLGRKLKIAERQVTLRLMQIEELSREELNERELHYLRKKLEEVENEVVSKTIELMKIELSREWDDVIELPYLRKKLEETENQVESLNLQLIRNEELSREWKEIALTSMRKKLEETENQVVSKNLELIRIEEVQKQLQTQIMKLSERNEIELEPLINKLEEAVESQNIQLIRIEELSREWNEIERQSQSLRSQLEAAENEGEGDKKAAETRNHEDEIIEVSEELEEQKYKLRKKEDEIIEAKKELEEQKYKLRKKEDELIEAMKELEEQKYKLGKKEEGLDDWARELNEWENQLDRRDLHIYKENQGLIKLPEASEKDSLGDWGLFIVKVLLELGLGAFEHFSEDRDLRKQVPAVIIALIVFCLSFYEVSSSLEKKRVIENRKIKATRIPWMPEVYCFLVSLLQFVLFVWAFWQPRVVRISMYSCILNLCLLLEKLLKNFIK